MAGIIRLYCYPPSPSTAPERLTTPQEDDESGVELSPTPAAVLKIYNTVTGDKTPKLHSLDTNAVDSDLELSSDEEPYTPTPTDLGFPTKTPCNIALDPKHVRAVVGTPLPVSKVASAASSVLASKDVGDQKSGDTVAQKTAPTSHAPHLRPYKAKPVPRRFTFSDRDIEMATGEPYFRKTSSSPLPPDQYSTRAATPRPDYSQDLIQLTAGLNDLLDDLDDL